MIIELDIFQTTALSILLLVLGKFIIKKVGFLKNICIPAPVIGGILFSLIHLALYNFGILSFSFNTTISTFFMTLFFTAVGYTSCFSLLKKGGKQIIVFVILSTVLIILQNALGAALASHFNLSASLGLAMGSIPMVGGHGTAGSFGVTLEEAGVLGASVVAIASATFGLVSGSLMGGPIGKSKIKKYNLKPNPEDLLMSESEESSIKASSNEVGTDSFLNSFILLIIAAGLGTYVTAWFKSIGITMPTYLGGLLIGVIVRNFCDYKKIEIPSKAMSIWSDVSLSIFLSIALTTMKLWELSELAIPMMVILSAQVLLMFFFANFIVFRATGGKYESAVLTAAFCGFGMGATPNAMANVQAITSKYGPCPTANIVVPVVGGMFNDLANAAVLAVFINILV